MKEQFREWNFRGDIKVTYTDGAGNKQIWQKNQSELLKQIVSIVTNYLQQDITLTNRQLYYQLVSKDIIPNADEIYKRICTFLTDARYAGLIDWEAIEDRGRVPQKSSEWSNIKSLIRSAISSYRLPRWDDQEYYTELYCEKQAMESVLKPVAEKYHIYFGVNKGYSSASTMYDLAQRIKEKVIDGKKARILYLGDHDASGLDMIRDIKERITEFLTSGDEPVDIEDYDGNAMFDIVPLALNMSQIKQYNPPPNPAKITDPRAKWYIQTYGNKSWELDALEPRVLIAIAEKGVLDYIDIDKYNAWIERENKEKQALVDFGNGLVKEEEKEEDENNGNPEDWLIDSREAKRFLLSNVEHYFEYEDKKTADEYGVKVGSKDFFCPICDDFWVNDEKKGKKAIFDELYEHIVKHSQEAYLEFCKKLKEDSE